MICRIQCVASGLAVGSEDGIILRLRGQMSFLQIHQVFVKALLRPLLWFLSDNQDDSLEITLLCSTRHITVIFVYHVQIGGQCFLLRTKHLNIGWLEQALFPGQVYYNLVKKLSHLGSVTIVVFVSSHIFISSMDSLL